MSPIDAGLLARFTNTSMRRLREMTLAFHNLDPESPDPVVAAVDGVDGTFDKAERRDDRGGRA